MLNNQGYKGVSLGIRKNDTKLKKEKELQNAIKANQANSTPAPNIVLLPPSQYVKDPGGTEEHFQSPKQKISNQEILRVIQFLDNDPELQYPDEKPENQEKTN